MAFRWSSASWDIFLPSKEGRNAANDVFASRGLPARLFVSTDNRYPSIDGIADKKTTFFAPAIAEAKRPYFSISAKYASSSSKKSVPTARCSFISI